MNDGISFIQYLNRIWFGDGARQRLGPELDHHGVRRPLLLSDAGLVASGVLDVVRPHARGIAGQFLDVPSNPTQAAVRTAVEEYRRRDCDGVVAVGGGSVLDCAKAVALAVTHDGELEQYSVETPGALRVSDRMTVVVAVPTTAGTGSEIGRGAAITLDSGRKAVYLSRNLIPRAAICDPELTHGLPPWLTAATGIDAFSHALEAFTAATVNPPADAVALDAIARLRHHLPTVVEDGADRHGRWQVMMGAVEAAMTTWKGLGSAHALSMPLERFELHHGTAIGLLLPHTFGYAVRTLSSDRVARLSTALGCDPDADSVVRSVAELVERLEMPRSLADFSVSADDLDAIAAEAAATTFHRSAPVPLSCSDYVRILERATPAPSRRDTPSP